MKLYTMAYCPKCELAKELLNKANIKYVEVSDAAEAISIGVTSAPCLVEDNGTILKFQDIIKLYGGNQDD